MRNEHFIKGLEAARDLAYEMSEEEVEVEARTRFVKGQLVGARNVAKEIQALIDRHREKGV